MQGKGGWEREGEGGGGGGQEAKRSRQLLFGPIEDVAMLLIPSLTRKALPLHAILGLKIFSRKGLRIFHEKMTT